MRRDGQELIPQADRCFGLPSGCPFSLVEAGTPQRLRALLTEGQEERVVLRAEATRRDEAQTNPSHHAAADG